MVIQKKKPTPRKRRKSDTNKTAYVEDVGDLEFLWHRIKRYKMILSVIVPVFVGTVYLVNFYEEHVPASLKVATQEHVQETVDPVAQIAFLTRADQLRAKLQEYYMILDSLRIIQEPTAEQLDRMRRLEKLIRGIEVELCEYDKVECNE